MTDYTMYCHCGRCKKPFIVNEYGKFFCSKACEAIDETPTYLLMSVPKNVPWKRRVG